MTGNKGESGEVLIDLQGPAEDTLQSLGEVGALGTLKEQSKRFNPVIVAAFLEEDKLLPVIPRSSFHKVADAEHISRRVGGRAFNGLARLLLDPQSPLPASLRESFLQDPEGKGVGFEAESYVMLVEKHEKELSKAPHVGGRALELMKRVAEQVYPNE